MHLLHLLAVAAVAAAVAAVAASPSSQRSLNQTAADLRTSNDTEFLESRAAHSNLTVDQALEGIAMDWQEEVIPGTRLADYGTNLDGFSRCAAGAGDCESVCALLPHGLSFSA